MSQTEECRHGCAFFCAFALVAILFILVRILFVPAFDHERRIKALEAEVKTPETKKQVAP